MYLLYYKYYYSDSNTNISVVVVTIRDCPSSVYLNTILY